MAPRVYIQKYISLTEAAYRTGGKRKKSHRLPQAQLNIGKHSQDTGGYISQPWPSTTLTTYSWALNTISKPTSSFSIPNTHSQSCLITPNLIRPNLIACIYFSLVLVPFLSLPHIHYPTSISFPLSDSLSSPPPSTLYHLTLNCLSFYPCYTLRSPPYIWSLISNLSWYISLSACTISSCTLSLVPQSDNQLRYFPYFCPSSFSILSWSWTLQVPFWLMLTRAEGCKTVPEVNSEISWLSLMRPPPPCYIS